MTNQEMPKGINSQKSWRRSIGSATAWKRASLASFVIDSPFFFLDFQLCFVRDLCSFHSYFAFTLHLHRDTRTLRSKTQTPPRISGSSRSFNLSSLPPLSLMVGKMRSAAGLFYAAVFAFMGMADAQDHSSKTTDMANKCAAVSEPELRIAIVAGI